jgi:sugar lactone lactonase YvrE
MMGHVEIIGITRDKVGESPIWSAVDEALYWVDIETCVIRRFHPASGKVSSWNTPERVGCIVLRQGGGLIAAMESGVFAVELRDSPELSCHRIAPVKHPRDNMRFNDGACDRRGRFWTGTMCMDSAPWPVGRLYAFVNDELNDAGIDGLVTQNGLAFSPDGRTMYLSDSHGSVKKIWAFDYDQDEGRPHGRREFVDMNNFPGRPDGAAIDSDGCYWICGNDAGVIHRFTPSGRLDRSIEIPVSKPSKCAFGGPRLDTMFITSIIPAAPADAEKILAGAVFAINPGVRGVAEPGYAVNVPHMVNP